MEEQEQHLQRRLSGEEGCEGDSNTPTQPPKPVQDDKVYDRIRGHERHILFHFFTLFSISFLIGVAFIHLSLWMNANIFSASSVCSSSAASEAIAKDFSKDNDNTAQTDTVAEKPLWNIVKATFYYTGEYFRDHSVNGSRTILHPS